MDALLTAEVYSGGAERRQIVAHGVSRGFPGAPHASSGGATENLAQAAILQLCRRSAAFLNADCPSGTQAPENGQSPGGAEAHLELPDRGPPEYLMGGIYLDLLSLKSGLRGRGAPSSSDRPKRNPIG